jgi:hypothetical protein
MLHNLSQSKSKNEIIRDLDHYEQNILIITALIQIYREFKGKSVVGKKLKCKSNEETQITPDLVTEFDYENGALGLISESKSSLPKDTERWIRVLEQIARYDQSFANWKKKIKKHDIMLVTDITISSRIWDFIKSPQLENNHEFIHNLAIVGYSRDVKMNNDIIVLKKDKGTLSHSDLERELDYARRVALKNILRDAENFKFYDSKPDDVYTMEILWHFIFPSNIPEEEYRKFPTNRSIPIVVRTDDILDIVRQRFSPESNPNVVKRSWIRDALNKFVELKLGEKLDKDGNSYKIYFRKKRQARSFLLDLMFKKSSALDSGQTTLDELNDMRS